MGIFTMACENESDNLSLDNSTDGPGSSSLRIASPTNSGTVLYSKYGVNLNGLYNNDDKSDWSGFWIYGSDLKSAITLLENSVTNFKIYRVGFSRPMANDDTDLNEWTNAIKVIADEGNKVIICLWGEHDYYIADSDASRWKNLLAKIEQKGLLTAVKGWELSNEPMNGYNLGKYYTNLYNKVGDWKGKKIILDGQGYSRYVGEDLYNGTSSISNRVFAVHAYSKYNGGGNPDLTKSVEDWKYDFIEKFNSWYQYANGNFIVTELGVGNPNFDNPTAGKEMREVGFIQACEQYFQGNTTVFWYSGFNTGGIGLINPKNGALRESSIKAVQQVFY